MLNKYCNIVKHISQNSRFLSLCSIRNNEAHTNGTFNKGQTHFGFQTVSENEKESRVHEVFHNVAEKYDLMNDIMSGGIHRLWKDYFIEALGPVPGTKLIDVAGGTGDIAFRFLDYVDNEDNEDDDDFDFKRQINLLEGISENDDNEYDGQWNIPQSSSVTVCDINQAMLDVGKKRAEQLGYTQGISWLKGNAECLPVADNSYDAYTIAFGIRNTTHIDKVLTEAHRVLKPGGRFMCLEFSQVNNTILRKIYDEYSFQVIPVMGKVVAGDWHSYQYLVESIRNFPNQKKFSKMIRAAGFKAVHCHNLTMGVAAIHGAFKL